MDESTETAFRHIKLLIKTKKVLVSFVLWTTKPAGSCLRIRIRLNTLVIGSLRGELNKRQLKFQNTFYCSKPFTMTSFSTSVKEKNKTYRELTGYNAISYLKLLLILVGTFSTDYR